MHPSVHPSCYFYINSLNKNCWWNPITEQFRDLFLSIFVSPAQPFRAISRSAMPCQWTSPCKLRKHSKRPGSHAWRCHVWELRCSSFFFGVCPWAQGPRPLLSREFVIWKSMERASSVRKTNFGWGETKSHRWKIFRRSKFR